MNKKRQISLKWLWLIVGLVALEVVLLVVTALFGSNIQLRGFDVNIPKITPTFSDLFTPMNLSGLVSFQDQNKIFYPENLDLFSNSLDSVIAQDSRFVKEADASYIIAGYVSDFNKSGGDNKSAQISIYDITLKNLLGEKYVEKIDTKEMESIEVRLREISPGSFSDKAASIDDVRVGDYLAINRVFHPLSYGGKLTLKVMIIRSSK